jgi:molecular chaperone DnaK
MVEESKIIGIDLGTTNSVVAVVEGDEPIVIPNQEGTNKTPSVVAFLDNNECIVGEIARRQATTNSSRTVNSIKRLMGLPFEEVEEWVDILPYQIVNHEDRLLIDVNGLGYSPEQISALIIKKLKESAESFLGGEVKQAVITVPANFDDNQRNATIEAARLAGLEVLRLINEPTAAALAYGLGKTAGADEIIAVYDFGGGTFDITVLEISDKTFEVLCSTGDAHLGGDDLDNALVRRIVEEFKEEHGVDLTKDPVTIRRLKEVAEKAKCELSSTSQAMITLPFIAYKDKTPLHLERRVRREDLEELIEPFVNRTIRCCKRAIDDAGLSKKEIKKVILVGGSTRIPLVQDAVEDFFGLAPFKGINPDEVVALGAATQAGVFSGNIEEVTLLDVAPHSLGIEVKDGKFSRIIEKNATIPIKAAKNFTTTEDNQSFVNIHILQGESDDAAENRSLGKFMLSDIPPMPKGRPRVRVTFFVNADAVMEISAEELTSGLAKSLTIVHSDLDSSERKIRKRARQRKGGSSRPSSSRAPAAEKRDTGGKRYGTETTGVPTSLPPGGRVRNADSSITALSPPTERDLAAFNKQRDSKEASPLPDSEEVIRTAETQHASPGFAAPTRYTRSGSAASNIAVPTPLKRSSDATQREEKGEIPTPPPVPPPDDAHTLRYDSKASTDETVFVDKAALQSGAQHALSALDIKTDIPTAAELEEVEWPGLIDSALDLAINSDVSPDAQDLYQKAIEALSRDPWALDARYAVLRARALLQSMLGRIDDFRASMSRIMDRYAALRTDDIIDLYQRAITRFPTTAILRRDRGRFLEGRGQIERACEDLEYASKLEPQDSDGAILERLYKARAAQTRDPAAQFKLVKIYLKTNRVDEAIEILQDLQHNEAYETRASRSSASATGRRTSTSSPGRSSSSSTRTTKSATSSTASPPTWRAPASSTTPSPSYEHLVQPTSPELPRRPGKGQEAPLPHQDVQQEEADQGKVLHPHRPPLHRDRGDQPRLHGHHLTRPVTKSSRKSSPSRSSTTTSAPTPPPWSASSARPAPPRSSAIPTSSASTTCSRAATSASSPWSIIEGTDLKRLLSEHTQLQRRAAHLLLPPDLRRPRLRP